jgi:uncharacterized protein YdeI (YjbR/CyaY-like superfamily)
VKELDFIHFKNRDRYRNWLQKNHDESLGIWMIFYKKHTNIECIEYNDALEEALCFGWIDSIIKKIDKDKYVRKFTPRKDTAKWSEINKKKAFELIQNGKMTQTGLAKIDVSILSSITDLENSKTEKKNVKELEIPDFIIDEFARNEPALINFNKLALTYKRHYILWITNAKREDTIIKRIKESIGLLKENKRLGLK